MFRFLSCCILLWTSISTGLAQTCCSGGVPLSSNLGLPAAEAHNLQLALTYDLNILNALKEGTLSLDDRSRNRKTHSLLWQVGYTVSRKLAVDALLSYVRQERTINNDAGRNFVHTEGLGDLVLLLKYRVWESRQQSSQWTLGAGTKLPTGPSDRSNDLGIRLNADLQPGSGATDLIFWSQLTHIGLIRPSMGFFFTTSYNRRGINKDYLPIVDPNTGVSRGQRYQFGNEWQIISGISDRLLAGKLILDPALSVRFRSVRYDRINDQRLPSTGGAWWFINPGITAWMSQRLSFNINAELPLYANIIGTQVSPSFRLNTGLFYRLPLKEEAEVLPTHIRLF